MDNMSNDDYKAKSKALWDDYNAKYKPLRVEFEVQWRALRDGHNATLPRGET